MNTASYSIKRRLLLWISIPILVVSALIILLALYFSWQEIEEVYDSQLVHTAKTLLQLTEREIQDGVNVQSSLSDKDSGLQHRYENKTAFRVWDGDRILLQSAKAETFPTASAAPGFSNQTIQGKPWRFFVYVDTKQNLRVETSERYAIRYELITQLMMSLAIPMAILIPSLLAIVWIGIRKSLRPLVVLSRTVDTRDSDDLNSIPLNDIPLEATPLVHALNRLFGRIAESFRREREFTDHAAHELRTPLAAMKTQTQVLMKKAVFVPECREGLDNLNITIDRSTHLVEQLLSLARLQNESLPLNDMNLSECLEDAVAEIKMRALAKNQTLTSDIAENVHIKGHSDSLYMLFRNLLENAVKYTPEGGTITASLSAEAKFRITDTGTGIADADKDRVFGRFVRVDKSGQMGSGLGLSIVQWIAVAHDTTLSLKDNTPSGLIIDMNFKTP